MKIFSEIVDGQYYFEIVLSENELERIQNGWMIFGEDKIDKKIYNVNILLNEEECNAFKKRKIKESDISEYSGDD